MPPILKHLLLASAEDPYSPHSWSGIPYSLRLALERRIDRVTVFQPGPPVRSFPEVLFRMALGSKRYPLWITGASLRANARSLRDFVAKDQPQAILSLGSLCVAELGEPPVPTFLFSDAPYESFQEAYRGTVDRPLRLHAYQAQEARIARKLHGLCYSSRWAVEEAKRLFGPLGRGNVPIEQRLHVTEMGCNWAPDLDREELMARVDARPRARLDFLFLGRDWERKGGPLAIEITRKLRERNIAATLHVVGCTPKLSSSDLEYVELHGALYRDNPVSAKKLSELFLNCHFLLTPTFAECFGLAFAEAQAFALPPVSRAVQGLPAVVVDGETGVLLDPASEAPAYVDRILDLWMDPAAYRRMTRAARDRYETLLNWDSMAARLVSIFESSLAEN